MEKIMPRQQQMQNSRQVYSAFFSKQYQKLVNMFRARYGNLSEMEIEDIVSDLMTELLYRSDIAGQIENIGAYIYRAVQNRITDYLRRRRKTVSLDETNGDQAGDSRYPEPGYDMQAEFESTEIRRRLLMALDTLKPDLRAVWIATEIDGALFRDLAESWNIPIGTLLARKHRAVAALQHELRDLKNY